MHPFISFYLWTGLVITPYLVGAAIAHNGSSTYRPLYSLHSNSTPIFQNTTGRTANPLIHALSNEHLDFSLEKRDNNGLPVGTCAPGTPCANGACCSKKGLCGFSPAECGKDTCISNCDAKAECGQYGVSGSNVCPLNVCCSKFGFCGTTEDFCRKGCQSKYGGCGSVKEPSCSGLSATERTIGYYEGWASTRPCDKRLPADLDVTQLTHINFAFAFFHPTSFLVIPMDARDTQLYPQFTALKEKKPSLKTWISIGGWSFNDATNFPNTQTAFSDLAASATNRQKFIKSVKQFMETWGFDGVDLDWEYPGADDRGGVPADVINYISLLKDMKSAFGTRYGLSVTLPASYWYLRWFDLESMQQHVDFLNIMTYDIHGVWDSSNKFTGPHIRPHTNITEIKQGLDLLWRNNVNPSMVNMGLGWYGRSFTLKDPSCNKPGCIFSEGGRPGKCTNASGTLSNAEIQSIMADRQLTPSFDRKAGVKWVTFDSDQWVSFDDGETIQMKISEANRLCLGGTLIWALDQDTSTHTSSNYLAGFGVANGITPKDAATVRGMQSKARHAATVRNSCYWSFCGESCAPGFIPTQAMAKGQVAGILRDTVCHGDEVQTLCCAPGTNTGTCSWHGWRGVGMPCASNYCPDDMEIIAVNTNSYEDQSDLGYIHDFTCNGGSQSYCCSGFVPSSYANTDSLNLVGRESQVAGEKLKARSKVSKDPSCFQIGSASIALLAGSLSWSIPLIFPTEHMSTGSLDLFNDKCVKEQSSEAQDYEAGIVARIGQGALGPNGRNTNPRSDKRPKHKKKPTMRGDYKVINYDENDKDCQVTYICRYGHGFDEVCDNQRWAIDKGLDGKKVYHKGARRAKKTHMKKWRNNQRDPAYRERAQHNDINDKEAPSRCDVDEFPMANLVEGDNKYQVVRLINGPANKAQGTDFENWLEAIYEPCLKLREDMGKPPPPITWSFGPFTEGDLRHSAQTTGEHFLGYYGFNSQTRSSECWATYTYTSKAAPEVPLTVTVTDHGFRALTDDPMFTKYGWPKNNYKKLPSEDYKPQDIHDGQWLKRDVVLNVLEQNLPLSAIEEADMILARKASQQASHGPTPTDASIHSEPRPTHIDTSRQSLDGGLPRETGSPLADDSSPEGHTRERRKRHLQMHQWHHGH